jgi:hypothetical protein
VGYRAAVTHRWLAPHQTRKSFFGSFFSKKEPLPFTFFPTFHQKQAVAFLKKSAKKLYPNPVRSAVLTHNPAQTSQAVP